MAENNTKVYSQKQEKMIADALGGYPVSGSGARPCTPGDVKTYEWLVECKTHTKPDNPILFNIDVWKKIEDEAMVTHRKPVLVVDDGSQSLSRTWCMCRSSNINLSGIITTDLPCTIRKNVSCKHDKLSDAIKSASKGVVMPGSFYTGVVFEVALGGENLIIMPFNTFKEIFEK